jgi:GT2 family glycosyltransferase
MSMENEAMRAKAEEEKAEAARPETSREGEKNLERQVQSFLKENLPDSEERIAQPMDGKCEVSVVIPAYAERDYILRPLESLASQKGTTAEQFETIIVVNNPGSEPARAPDETDADYKRKVDLYHKAIGENQETLKLVRHLGGGGEAVSLSEKERQVVDRIKASGLRVFAVDKASPGKTLPPEDANVGGARNRGVAEAVARFYEQAGRNGIIAQSDADTRFDEHYIENLIRVFKERPDLIGLTGEMSFEEEGRKSELARTISMYEEAEYRYHRLLDRFLANREEQAKAPAFAKDVHFSGANMASRAFEAAAVGGVPKKAGGEDPEFGYRLSALGEIDRVPEVRTRPADRFSARTAVWAGHGQRKTKFFEAFEQRRTIDVENLEVTRIKKRVAEQLTGFTGGPDTAERLKAILSAEGKPMLDEDDIKLLEKKFSEYGDFRKMSGDEEVKALGMKFSSRLVEAYPDVPLEQAAPELLGELKKEKDLSGKQEAILEQVLATERAAIGNRLKALEGVFEAVYRAGDRDLDGDKLLSVLRKEGHNFGLDQKMIEALAAEPDSLEKLARLASSSGNTGEALSAAEGVFRDRLTMPEPGTMRMLELELRATHEASRELGRKK